MLVKSLAAVIALAAPCFSSPLANTHAVHEKRDSLPHGWVRRDAVHKRDILPMRIALAQNNIHKSHDWLMEVSHPESEKFGKHWTAEEVAKAFAPR